jgi:integrase
MSTCYVGDLRQHASGLEFHGETTPGGIIWHDLRRTFATRLRAHGVHEYDIQDLLGHSKPGVTTVYARATHAALEAAGENLIEPIAQLVQF